MRVDPLGSVGQKGCPSSTAPKGESAPVWAGTALHGVSGLNLNEPVPPYDSEEDERIVLAKFLQLSQTDLHTCHANGGLEDLMRNLYQFTEDDDALEVAADMLKKEMGWDWTTVAYLVKRLLQCKRNDAALNPST